MDQNRVLSDEELVLLGLSFYQEPWASFDDPRSFLAANPDCCSIKHYAEHNRLADAEVDPEGMIETRLARLGPSRHVAVFSVAYPHSEFESSTVYAAIWLSACGVSLFHSSSVLPR